VNTSRAISLTNRGTPPVLLERGEQSYTKATYKPAPATQLSRKR
jgi:hypothetical protein